VFYELFCYRRNAAEKTCFSFWEVRMTTEMLTLTAGALLSLCFSYIPGLAGWYARLGETPEGDDGGTRKRLVMLGALALAAAGSFGLACLGWGPALGLDLTCDQGGGLGLLRALVLALVANQATYKISPRLMSRVTGCAGES
jgi:hypothetical protein